MWPKIIEILNAKGFSQKAIAERAGVDQSTICRLARPGSPEPRFSAGQALIEMCGGHAELERLGIGPSQQLLAKWPELADSAPKHPDPSAARSSGATESAAQGVANV